MKVNVICDDGFQQVIQVSKSTVARQLCEEICRIRQNLRIVSASPSECILSTIDTREYLSSEAVVMNVVAASSKDFVEMHMSGFKSKEEEICRLYDVIMAQRSRALVVSESNSSSSSSSTAKPMTNIQQCCKEIIGNIEKVFDQSIQSLNATNAIKNSNAKKNVLLLDAIGKHLFIHCATY